VTDNIKNRRILETDVNDEKVGNRDLEGLFIHQQIP
jgi:hypothetical protein